MVDIATTTPELKASFNTEFIDSRGECDILAFTLVEIKFETNTAPTEAKIPKIKAQTNSLPKKLYNGIDIISANMAITILVFLKNIIAPL